MNIVFSLDSEPLATIANAEPVDIPVVSSLITIGKQKYIVYSVEREIHPDVDDHGLSSKTTLVVRIKIA